jgi:hypothetical protein
MEARVAGGEATENDDNYARLTSDHDTPTPRSSSLEDSPVGMRVSGGRHEGFDPAAFDASA